MTRAIRRIAARMLAHFSRKCARPGVFAIVVVGDESGALTAGATITDADVVRRVLLDMANSVPAQVPLSLVGENGGLVGEVSPAPAGTQ